TWRITPKIFAECRHRILQGDRLEHVAVESVQNAKISLANARCILEHGLEHRLQLPGEELMTCSTSEVAVCRSSDSVKSRVRACTSSNSRAFSIAITAWSAKVLSSVICFSVNGLTSKRRIKIAPIGSPCRNNGAASVVL